MTDEAACTRRAAALALLNRLPYALIIVDDRGHALTMNAAARETFSRAQGVRLDGDVIHAVSATDDRQLSAAIAAATGPAASWLSGAMALRIDSGSAELPLLVLPARVTVDPLIGRRGLAYVIFGGHEQTPHRDLLVSMYGLTGREADVACALIGGQDLAHAAQGLRMTIHTARTHLRHLMEKTATARQGDLIRVLLGSTPPHT